MLRGSSDVQVSQPDGVAAARHGARMDGCPEPFETGWFRISEVAVRCRTDARRVDGSVC